MKKEIIISEANDLAVVFEDGRAAEFFLRSGDQLVGDIIWGQVEAVVPGIEAAFVNIGQDRNGFIHVADLPSAQTPRKQSAPKRPSIRVRERILVQISKAPTGGKGARLTGRLTIPGRFLVLVPDDNRVSISRRIVETHERDRLRRLTLKLKDPGHGLIVRTEAIGRSEEDLRQDIDELIEIWGDILHQVQIVNPPALLHRDSDLIHRVLRDATTGDVAKVVVDTAGGYQNAREILKGWMPELERHVTQHKGPHSIMQRYRIREELEAAINPKVWLPSGGNLVIEHTEALTVVDVNSSRSTQSRSLADTVLKTNMEAATEVARQLRLRDIGGIIVIDFISMDAASDRNKVLQAFHEALKQDKSRPQVTNFSEHGLIEVSRRRQGQNLLEQLTTPCEACGGTGRIRSTDLLEPVDGERTAANAYEEEEEVAIEEIDDADFVTEVALGENAGTEDDEDGVNADGSRRRRRRRGRGRGRGRTEGAPQTAGAEGSEEGFEDDEDEFVEEIVAEVVAPKRAEPARGRGRGAAAAAEPAARAPRGGRPPAPREEFEEDAEESSMMVEEVSLGDMFATPARPGETPDRGGFDRNDRGDRGGRGRGGRDRGDRPAPFERDRPAGGGFSSGGFDRDRAPAAGGRDRGPAPDRGFGGDRDRNAGGGRDRGFGGGDRDRGPAPDRGFGGDRDRNAASSDRFGGDRDRNAGGGDRFGGDRDRNAGGGDRFGGGRDRGFGGGDRDRGPAPDRGFGGDRDRNAGGGRDRFGGDRDRAPAADRGFGGDRGPAPDRGFGNDRGPRPERDRGGFDRERAPRETRPAATSVPTEPGAFTVSAPAPRTRRVERKGEGAEALPTPVAQAPERQPRQERFERPALVEFEETTPVERKPAPARTAAPTPAAAPVAKAPAAEKPAKPVRAEAKPRTAPLPIPEKVEQAGVPGLFVLKKKAAPTAAPAAPEADGEDDAKSTKRAAAPTRRAPATKVAKPAAEEAAAPAAAPKAAKAPAKTAAKAAPAAVAAPVAEEKPAKAAPKKPAAAKKPATKKDA